MRSPLAVLLLTACASADDKGASPVTLELGQVEVRAGEAVSYTVGVTGRPGADQARPAALHSSLEDELVYSSTAIYPRIAGTHRLRASTPADGSASAELVVLPGPAIELQLELESALLPAGASTSWQVQGHDALGNAVDPAAVTLELPAGVEQLDGLLTSTVAGTHTLHARVDGLTATASLEIAPAAPTALSLSAAQYGTTLSTDARLTDSHGNRVRGEIALDVACHPAPDGAAAVVVGPDVYFLHEGQCALTATHSPPTGEPLRADAGPYAIDWSPPALFVAHPARGSWHSTGPLDIEGTAIDAVAGLDHVRIHTSADDTEPAPELTGSPWERPVALPFGMTRIETWATDLLGNTVRDFRATVAGPQRLLGDAESEGIIVRLHDSPTGTGSLAEIAAASTASVDLAATLPAPLIEGSEQVCTTIPPFPEVCRRTSIEASISAVRWQTATVDFTPRVTGTLQTTVTLHDLTLDWDAEGKLLGASYAVARSGSAHSLGVDMAVELDVVDGAFDAGVTIENVQLVDLDIGMDSTTQSATSTLGLDFESVAESALEANAASLLAPVIETAIEDALRDLTLDTGWVDGPTLVAQPETVSVDRNGITLALSTVADLPLSTDTSGIPGALVQPYSGPVWGTPDGAALAVSLNALNQMIHANWAAGVLDLEGTDEDFDIDMTLFTATLPGISDLRGRLQASYPPFAVPDGSGGLLLELPELRLDLYDGDVVDDTEVYTIYLTISAPIAVVLEEGLMEIDWGEQDTWMDVVRAPPDADLFFLETVLESLSGAVVLDRYNLLDVLPLPRIGGYTLDAEVVLTDGAEGAYLLIPGDFRAD